jgi:hypothetical protein
MWIRIVSANFIVAFAVAGLATMLDSQESNTARTKRASQPAPCPDTLIRAVVQGNATCVERILAAKPLESVKGDGYEPASPLVMAAALGYTRIVELLLPSHAAHVNRAAVVAAGGRPTASSVNTVDVLFKQSLTQEGGVPTKNLALGIALVRCHDDIVESLKAGGLSSIPNEFHVAMNNPMHKVDEQLYELGIADPWLAAQRGDLDRLQKSLPESPGPNVTTRCGETPLMRASRYNQLAAVKYLLGRGAEVNLRNKGGETALMLAAKYPEIVRVLEDAGAKK